MCGDLNNSTLKKKKTIKESHVYGQDFSRQKFERLTTSIIYNFRAKRNAKKYSPCDFIN